MLTFGNSCFVFLVSVCSNDGSFWATTGLFPQEFIIQLAGPSAVSQIKTVSTNGE